MLVIDALQLVTNICNDFKGNLKDHKLIQEALQIITDKVESKEVKDVKTEK